MHLASFVRVPHFASLAVVAMILALPAAAQVTETAPHLPPGPQPVPGQTTGPFGAIATENFLVTSAANEHGSYLWIVGPAQHVVILCEKPDNEKDFHCTTKRLP